MAQNSSELNGKMLIFAQEYARDRNATRAAVAAGYAAKTAAQAASRLLRNVKVREKIDGDTRKRLVDLDIDAKRVLKGLAQLAFYDPRQMFGEDGQLKPMTELDEICAMAIKGIDVDTVIRSRKVRPIEPPKEDGKKTADARQKSTEPPEPKEEEVLEVRVVTSKIRLADRGENLERLGRHLKLFTDRFEFEDQTPYDPERDGARIAQILAEAVRGAGTSARP